MTYVLAASRGNKRQWPSLSTEQKCRLVDAIVKEIGHGATKGVAQRIVVEREGLSRNQVHQVWNGRPYE